MFCVFGIFCINMQIIHFLHIWHNVHICHIDIEISISAYFRLLTFVFELFAYCTSRTTSIEANCSAAVFCRGFRHILDVNCFLLHNLHILQIIVCTRWINPSRRSVPLFAINGHQHNERSHARCRDLHWFLSVKVCLEVNWDSNCKQKMKSRRQALIQQLNFLLLRSSGQNG